MQSRGQVMILIVACFVVASGVNAYYFMQLLLLTDQTAFSLKAAFAVWVTHQAHSDFWHVEVTLVIVTGVLAAIVWLFQARESP